MLHRGTIKCRSAGEGLSGVSVPGVGALVAVRERAGTGRWEPKRTPGGGQKACPGGSTDLAGLYGSRTPPRTPPPRRDG